MVSLSSLAARASDVVDWSHALARAAIHGVGARKAQRFRTRRQTVRTNCVVTLTDGRRSQTHDMTHEQG